MTQDKQERVAMTFGEKVKIARKKQFLSQEAMAKELGLSRSSLARWELGLYEPSYPAQKAFREFCVKHGIKFEDKE